MKIIAIREVRKNPAVLYSDSEYRVLTSNNKPKALCFPLDESENIEEIAAAFRQARTMTAVERVRYFALEKELDGLSMEEIDREISAARKKDED